MSEIKKYIKQLLKEKKYYKNKAKHYKDLYFGLIPPDNIHIKKEHWMKILQENENLKEELKQLRGA